MAVSDRQSEASEHLAIHTRHAYMSQLSAGTIRNIGMVRKQKALECIQLEDDIDAGKVTMFNK